MALLASAAVGLGLFYHQPAQDPASIDPPIVVAQTFVPAEATTEPVPAPQRYVALLDAGVTLGYAPMPFARSAPIDSRFQPVPDRAAPPVTVAMAEPEPAPMPVLPPLPAERVADVPMPLPRPALLDETAPLPPTRRIVAAIQRPVAAVPAQPSFFDRLFRRPAQPAGPALAYAAPEDASLGNLFGRTASPDRYTAVDDISAHVVTLPDGERLEAHSGLGAARDNPGSVTEHMRGATPPNVYELTPRESLFHGVAALRLNPVGGTTYGRGGLLAHSYMLRGRPGDSNGCVVFRDYAAFRAAYDRGEIRRLIVVAGG